jgi:tRNA(fMet)-specific endonuclease VapC
MVCVDTSFIIALIRRDSQAESKLEQLTREAERIFTTPICACELFAGAYKSTKKDLEIRKVREILSRMELLEFSIQACERFGRIREQMHTGGSYNRRLGHYDSFNRPDQQPANPHPRHATLRKSPWSGRRDVVDAVRPPTMPR